MPGHVDHAPRSPRARARTALASSTSPRTTSAPSGRERASASLVSRARTRTAWPRASELARDRAADEPGRAGDEDAASARGGGAVPLDRVEQRRRARTASRGSASARGSGIARTRHRGRHEDDRACRGGPRRAPQRLEELGAVHHRHDEVEHDEVGPAASAASASPSAPFARGRDGVALGREALREASRGCRSRPRRRGWSSASSRHGVPRCDHTPRRARREPTAMGDQRPGGAARAQIERCPRLARRTPGAWARRSIGGWPGGSRGATGGSGERGSSDALLGARAAMDRAQLADHGLELLPRAEASPRPAPRRTAGRPRGSSSIRAGVKSPQKAGSADATGRAGRAEQRRPSSEGDERRATSRVFIGSLRARGPPEIDVSATSSRRPPGRRPGGAVPARSAAERLTGGSAARSGRGAARAASSAVVPRRGSTREAQPAPGARRVPGAEQAARARRPPSAAGASSTS